MLKKTLVTITSWSVGIIGVIAIFWYYQPRNFTGTLAAIGAHGIAGWVALTLVARVCASETTVRPLNALGYHMTRPDSYWISWIRTFVNQLWPIAGAAAYIHLVRRRTGISWSHVAALGQPQLLLVAAAIGIVGVLATVANLGRHGAALYGLGLMYLVLVVLALAFASGAHWLVESLPKALANRAVGTSEALRTIAKHPTLIAEMSMLHAAAALLRGARLWILFHAAGVSLNWAEALLVIAIAESSLLFSITPGALGFREGAVLGGAALVGVPAPVASSVALIDRLFMLAITTLLAAPAYVILRRPHDS